MPVLARGNINGLEGKNKMAKQIKGFIARLVSVEATVHFEEPMDTSSKFIFEMTRNTLKVMKGDEMLTPKNIKFDINNAGGGTDLDHSEVWKKLQGYAPKATFRLPVISVIDA